MFALVLMLSAMLETASITKRSYSDQSVRGYVTEVLITNIYQNCPKVNADKVRTINR